MLQTNKQKTQELLNTPYYISHTPPVCLSASRAGGSHSVFQCHLLRVLTLPFSTVSLVDSMYRLEMSLVVTPSLSPVIPTHKHPPSPLQTPSSPPPAPCTVYCPPTNSLLPARLTAFHFLVLILDDKKTMKK